MTLEDIAAKVSGAVEVSVPGAEASSAYVGDLLSDVMGHAGDDSVLITVQNHLNTIAVCTLAGIRVISPREGNGNPLQYSCLENSMDGGAWWAAVHGIAKSRAWLGD